MGIVQNIHEDMKEAMRSGDSFRRDTLRFLESAIKNVAIEKRISFLDLSDEEALFVIRRSVKQRCDSAFQYREGGREELAQKEDAEQKLLSMYLPVAPTDDVIRDTVIRIIKDVDASSMKDIGKVIGLVVKSLPTASGSDIRRIAEELLRTS